MDRRPPGYRPSPIPFTDDRGRNCLRVPLDPYGRDHATVLARDYEQVRKDGAIGCWRLNANSRGQRYVRTHVPTDRKGENVLVARLITGAGRKSTIYYANKDRLDLRPENLFWHRNGVAKRRDVEIARRGAEIRAARKRAAA